MEKFSIPSAEMSEEYKQAEHKSESMVKEVSTGSGILSCLVVIGFGIMLSFTGIGIIIGFPLIMVGVFGIFAFIKEANKNSINVVSTKKDD